MYDFLEQFPQTVFKDDILLAMAEFTDGTNPEFIDHLNNFLDSGEETPLREDLMWVRARKSESFGAYPVGTDSVDVITAASCFLVAPVPDLFLLFHPQSCTNKLFWNILMASMPLMPAKGYNPSQKFRLDMLNQFILLTFILFTSSLSMAQQQVLIPMDASQTDHLKAYGVVFNHIKDGFKAKWLLNYRGVHS